MKIYPAEERSEINVDIKDVVKEGGKLDISPNVKNFFSIDYKPKRDRLTLFAGKYIGLIPINNSLAVDIKPRFSISNLTRIVSIAEDSFNALGFFSREYKESGVSEPVVFAFMVESLCNELRALYEEGVLKEYVYRQEASHKIRGRININHSVKKLWSYGHFNKAIVQYYEQTADNSFNQLVKYTLEYCLCELSSIFPEKKALRNELSFYYSLFESVDSGRMLSSYHVMVSAIQNEKISELRHYYKNICEICRLIVEGKGVSFNDTGSDLQLSSFTLDMESTFEKYLLNSLRKNKDLLSLSISVLDGNNEGRKKLYNQPSYAKGDAKPDMIIQIDNIPVAIADAKYKNKSKDSDRYQVISHALSYNCKVAVLVLPKDKDYKGEQLVKLGDIGVGYIIEVYEYYFDLSSGELELEEKLFSEALGLLVE